MKSDKKSDKRFNEKKMRGSPLAGILFSCYTYSKFRAKGRRLFMSVRDSFLPEFAKYEMSGEMLRKKVFEW